MLNPNHYIQFLINIVSVNAHSTCMEFLCVDLHHKVSAVGQRLAHVDCVSAEGRGTLAKRANESDVSRLTD